MECFALRLRRIGHPVHDPSPPCFLDPEDPAHRHIRRSFSGSSSGFAGTDEHSTAAGRSADAAKGACAVAEGGNGIDGGYERAGPLQRVLPLWAGALV